MYRSSSYNIIYKEYEVKNTLFNRAFGGINKGEVKFVNPSLFNREISKGKTVYTKKELEKIYPPKEELLDEGLRIG